MKKAKLLVGVGIGFVLGSWAGREPYEGLAHWTRQTIGGEKTKAALKDTLDDAKSRAAAVTDSVKNKLPGSSSGGVGEPATGFRPMPATYPDPQDIQFGKAAAEKEDTLDDLMEQGVDPAQVQAIDEGLHAAGQATKPRPGNKAEPSGS
jgi:hypothetical protein